MNPSLPSETEVAILGAGMSGLCMAINLLRAGKHDFVMLEKSAGIGGTWWDNTYPGAQCDVRSHLYTYTFAPNANWSQVFAPQREILEYMQGLVAKWGIHRHLHLNTELRSARFDAERGCWNLHTGDGNAMVAKALVCSTGPLCHPRFPAIPGLENFTGKLMHTARWDHSIDPAGKSAAVIGTAASAVQVVPPLARAAQKLSIFQRTPNWLLPRNNRPYPRWERGLYAIPPIGKLARWYSYGWHERARLGFEQGTVAAKFVTRLADSHREKQVQDIRLRAKLRPDYPLGCKRVLLSDDYYPALQRPNVELITDPIERIESNAIRTSEGTLHRVDVIVCATGFDTVRPMKTVDIRGLSGASLSEKWQDHPRAYHGVSVPDFPNLFLLLGPNTGTGHTSTLNFIEPQVAHVLRCLKETQRRDQRWISIKPEVFEQHQQSLQAALSNTVWAGACGSWYKNASGKIVAIYPGTSYGYARALRQVDLTNFQFG